MFRDMCFNLVAAYSYALMVFSGFMSMYSIIFPLVSHPNVALGIAIGFACDIFYITFKHYQIGNEKTV